MIHRRLAAFLLLTIVFSACQPGGSQISTPGNEGAATKSLATAESAEIDSELGVREDQLNGVTLEVWHPWYGASASLFDSRVEEFNRTNGWGVLVKSVGLQNFTELYAQTDAAIHGPDRPDVVVGLPEYALEWYAEDAVVDLTPYVSDPLYGLSATEIADFPSVILEQDQIDQVRLGMPAQRTGRFLLYNQTWAKELGFTGAPASAEEFQDQACKANQAMHLDEEPLNDGEGGWLIDTHPMADLAWLLAFGGGAQEAEGFRFLIPENIEAVRYLKALAENNCAWKSGEDEHLNAFVDRSALFATASLEDLPGLARDFAVAGSKDEWTVLPFPGPAGNAFVVYGSSYIILESDSAKQLASWLFVRWLLSSDNQVDWVKSAGFFPLQASTLGLLADYEAGHPQWAEAVKLLPQGHITPQLVEWRKVRVALGDGFTFMFRVDTPVGRVPAILAQLDEIAKDLSE